MERMDICQKCGMEKMVRDHHIKGYDGEYKNIVVPYCRSCDYKAHNKARREGRCKLTGEESHKLTRDSYNRRTNKILYLSINTVDKNIRLIEELNINIATNTISISSFFAPSNKKKILFLGE